VFNMIDHTGFHSCHVCEIKGKYDSKVVFPFKELSNLSIRTKSSYEEALKELNSKNLSDYLGSICLYFSFN
jgi:threonine synthase